ncbi:MAG: outer membrane beta-barrel protein [Hyphomonadaceae bacterium]
MAAKGKKRRLGRALAMAVSLIALSSGIAAAQDANDLESLNQEILNNPSDVQLNLRYARLAEQEGKLRLALVAYERILINDPTNEAARRGYERIRREIEPSYTVFRAEIGARWDTNAVNADADALFVDADELEATTYYAHMMIADEREFLGRRWRSAINLDIERTPDIDELDYQYLGVQTGPIFYVAPHLALIPQVGAGISWLDGEQYYNDVHANVTLEGRTGGSSYWVRARAGYRDYNPDTFSFFSTVTEEGPYAEVRAGIAKPRVFSERDAVHVEPFVRWSDVEGSQFSFWLLDDVAPGKYFEYGADIRYQYQFGDHFQGAGGLYIRERDFGDSRREDTYVSPYVSLTWQDALPCECDLRLQYRYRDNDSNDTIANYDADQVSLALLARF